MNILPIWCLLCLRRITYKIQLFWFLSCFLLLWSGPAPALIFCLWLKRKIFLVLVSHFYFLANDCFFSFERYIIYCMENSSFCRCFLEGGTPFFGLDGSVPLSRAWFSGSWSGILYKNVKVGYKQSTFVMLIWKINYFCMRKRIRDLSYGLFS